MNGESGIVALLLDVLQPLGALSVRRMFGAAGVFCDGTMFAIIEDGLLFLKADATNRADFEAEGLSPFSYETRDGRTVVMSYWRAPERLLDDADAMVAWAGKALGAAHRSGARSRPAGRDAMRAASRRRKPAR